MSRVLLFLLLFSSLSVANSRDISSIAKHVGKYLIISKPVSIVAGDTLTVSNGQEVLFSTYSGITVQPGACLLARGTKDKPIYFTSLQDTANAAAAFDWNGIDIKRGASAQFTFCFVAFSTSGITAEDSVGVKIDNCIFSVNGQWSLSVSGVIIQVKDLQSFSWLPKQTQSATVIVTQKDTTPIIPQIPQSAHHPKYKTRDLVLSGVGVLCLAAGVSSLFLSSKYRSEYNSFVPGNNSYDVATPQARQNQFATLRKSHVLSTAIGWSCIGLALVDGVVLAITLRF